MKLFRKHYDCLPIEINDSFIENTQDILDRWNIIIVVYKSIYIFFSSLSHSVNALYETESKNVGQHLATIVVDVHDFPVLALTPSVFLVIKIVVLHLRWELLLVRLSVVDCDHGVSGQREKKYFLEWLIIYCRRPLKRTIKLLTVYQRLVGQGIDRVC